MGRKRSWTWQYLYLCLAGVIALVQGGCAVLTDLGGRDEARYSLLWGQELLAQGDYEGSLRENQRALSLAGGRPPADEAIFKLGLIYAHPGNPRKDYRRAVGYFRNLARDFPRSPLAEQAKIWIGVLETSERLAQANEKLTEMLERLKKVDMEIEQKSREKGR